MCIDFCPTKEDARPARGPLILVDTFIESSKFGFEENRIIKIAWEAVERRREAAAKQGKQLQIDGKTRENGYAVYKDYNQHMEERKQRDKLGAADFSLGKVRFKIRATLLSKRWTASAHHPETRFYPPNFANIGNPTPTLL